MVSVALIVFGFVFGGTWSSTGVCLGDNVFYTLGLPAWSKQTSGTHYPAIVGMVIILVGIAVLNATLSKRNRIWVWSITILVTILIGISMAYV